MKRILSELVAMVRDALVMTFVDPVKEGRPHPRSWPRGLPAIGAAVLVIYVLLAIAALFSVTLRQSSSLVLSSSSMITLPESTIWLLQCGVVMSFALVHTAALHTSWWLRAILFLLGSGALIFFISPALITAPWVAFASALMYVGLLIFTLVRARREFVWWEFVVVTVFVAITMLGPAMVTGFGLDSRIVAIEAIFSSLGLLTYPALLVAGAAPAQIVVTGATAITSRPVIRPFLWALAVLGVGWLTVSTILDLQAGADELNLSALLASTIGLAAILGILALWLVRGHQRAPDHPSTYPDSWGSWLYPLAIAIAGLVVVIMPVSLLSQLERFTGPSKVTYVISLVTNVFSSINSGVYWRAGIGVVLLVIAWRISSRGRVVEAMLLSSLSVATILDGLGLVPSLAFLHERNVQITGLIATGAALLIGCVLLIRRSLTRDRAIWIVTVVLLAVLYPYRNFMDDPAGAALFFSAQLLLLFGLTWRLLTGAGFLDGDSRVFPRPTRVLLFMANSLFAATSIAFIALARATATTADSSAWADAGDWTLGEPLYVAGLVAALWLLMRPKTSPSQTSTDDQASQEQIPELTSE